MKVSNHCFMHWNNLGHVLSVKVLNCSLLHSIFYVFSFLAGLPVLPYPAHHRGHHGSKVRLCWGGGLSLGGKCCCCSYLYDFSAYFHGGRNFFLAVAVPHPTRQRQGCQKHVFWSFPSHQHERWLFLGQKSCPGKTT